MNFSTPENSTIVVEALLDLSALHAEDRPVQIDVLAAGELRVEARSDLEQAADAAANLDAARGRRGDAREDLEQRRLAGAVSPDDAEHLALLAPRTRRRCSAQISSAGARCSRPVSRLAAWASDSRSVP